MQVVLRIIQISSQLLNLSEHNRVISSLRQPLHLIRLPVIRYGQYLLSSAVNLSLEQRVVNINKACQNIFYIPARGVWMTWMSKYLSRMALTRSPQINANRCKQRLLLAQNRPIILPKRYQLPIVWLEIPLSAHQQLISLLLG